MTETGSSWEEFLNLRYYPDGYGKIPEKSFRQVHLDRLTPDQLQTMTQSGFCLKWHDSIGRPLIYHLVDTTCGLRPITPEVLDYLLKNGLSSNAYVTSFSESSVSLIEQIARDSHPIRRQDYLKCLFQNGINLLRDSCGSKAIFTLIALHKERASSDVRLILNQNQLDVEKPGTSSRSILDWADNGFFCDKSNRDTIYAYYRGLKPEAALKRKQDTQSLFFSQQESRQAQELNAFSKAEQDFFHHLNTEKQAPPKPEPNAPHQDTPKDPKINEELCRQGIQLIHLAGAVLSALGTQAQKIDTQDIIQLSPQKIREFLKALTR